MRLLTAFFLQGAVFSSSDVILNSAPPNAFLTTVRKITFTRDSHNNLKYEGKPVVVDAYTHVKEMNAIAFLEDKKVKCLDEFFGLSNMDTKKIQTVLASSPYEFCGPSAGSNMAIDDYNIEARLTCDNKEWVRLDCKFTPKDKPDGSFLASRIGTRKTAVTTLVRGAEKIKDKAKSVMMDTEENTEKLDIFSKRVPCDNQLEKSNIDECTALLRGWAALDDAFEKQSPAAHHQTSDDHTGDETVTSEDDWFAFEKSSPYALYIIGGVLGLAALGIGIKILLGGSSKKKGDKMHGGKPKKHRKHGPDHQDDEVDKSDEGESDDLDRSDDVDGDEPQTPQTVEEGEREIVKEKLKKRKPTRGK